MNKKTAYILPTFLLLAGLLFLVLAITQEAAIDGKYF